MKATITSLIFLLLSLTVSSQTYKYIGIEEGLSNQKIYKIQKDARGYMWFLTHVGIDQYNGKEIKHYKLREGNRELDPLLNINWTFLDKTGTLLVYRSSSYYILAIAQHVSDNTHITDQ